MSDTPETDEELAELGFGFYCMGGLPADAVKVEFARKLERERNEALKNASNNLHQYVKANLRIEKTNVYLEEIKNEHQEAVSACHIWQQGHSAIVADRDYWKAEAERWRDCHHEIIADRDWLILELVEISSTADNCENTWDGLHKIAVIADNILNGRGLP